MEKKYPRWLSDLTNDWGGFLLKVAGLKTMEYINDYRFDFYFAKTSFVNREDEEVFFADEMHIKIFFEEDGEWCESDQTYYSELICGDDRENDFKTNIFYNIPKYDGASLGDGWSNSGEMTFDESVNYLKGLGIIDYELLSEDEKDNFKYFSSSKLKNKK